jgi:hypothetical protein
MGFVFKAHLCDDTYLVRRSSSSSFFFFKSCYFGRVCYSNFGLWELSFFCRVIIMIAPDGNGGSALL